MESNEAAYDGGLYGLLEDDLQVDSDVEAIIRGAIGATIGDATPFSASKVTRISFFV
jgi:hypothetical protein